jgi:hypothetical protein
MHSLAPLHTISTKLHMMCIIIINNPSFPASSFPFGYYTFLGVGSKRVEGGSKGIFVALTSSVSA